MWLLSTYTSIYTDLPNIEERAYRQAYPHYRQREADALTATLSAQNADSRTKPHAGVCRHGNCDNNTQRALDRHTFTCKHTHTNTLTNSHDSLYSHAKRGAHTQRQTPNLIARQAQRLMARQPAGVTDRAIKANGHMLIRQSDTRQL